MGITEYIDTSAVSGFIGLAIFMFSFIYIKKYLSDREHPDSFDNYLYVNGYDNIDVIIFCISFAASSIIALTVLVLYKMYMINSGKEQRNTDPFFSN